MNKDFSYSETSQMVQTPTKNLTLEEFLKLPETKPASEYINGQIIQKTMPQGKHSIIQGELVYPPGKQPELLQEAEEVLPVPEIASELRLTLGDLFSWLKL